MRTVRLCAFATALASLLLADAAVAQPSATGTAPAPVTVAGPSEPVVIVPVKRKVRSGFMFGANFGRGRLAVDCRICDNVDPLTEALSYAVHAGWMITPRLAAVAEYWAVRYNDRGSDFFDDSSDHLIAQKIVTAQAQVWVHPRVWVKGGLGVGRHISDSLYAKPHLYNQSNLRAGRNVSVPESEQARDWTPAAVVAVGFEYARKVGFALDVQVRAATTHRPKDEYQVHNIGVVFGFNWY